MRPTVGKQATFEDVAVEARKRALYWTPDNPNVGNAVEPGLNQSVVRRYREDPDSLPYAVPMDTDKTTARNHHRTWYWLEHDFEGFVCPDCRRDVGSIRSVEVHHIDENPLNGAPENLVALCGYCHRHRHGEEKGEGRRPLEFWMREFPADVGGGSV